MPLYREFEYPTEAKRAANDEPDTIAVWKQSPNKIQYFAGDEP